MKKHEIMCCFKIGTFKGKKKLFKISVALPRPFCIGPPSPGGPDDSDLVDRNSQSILAR